jgi:hypothetical protein
MNPKCLSISFRSESVGGKAGHLSHWPAQQLPKSARNNLDSKVSYEGTALIAG